LGCIADTGLVQLSSCGCSCCTIKMPPGAQRLRYRDGHLTSGTMPHTTHYTPYQGLIVRMQLCQQGDRAHHTTKALPTATYEGVAWSVQQKELPLPLSTVHGMCCTAIMPSDTGTDRHMPAAAAAAAGSHTCRKRMHRRVHAAQQGVHSAMPLKAAMLSYAGLLQPEKQLIAESKQGSAQTQTAQGSSADR
jgi:hypothetical protein